MLAAKRVLLSRSVNLLNNEGNVCLPGQDSSSGCHQLSGHTHKFVLDRASSVKDYATCIQQQVNARVKDAKK